MVYPWNTYSMLTFALPAKAMLDKTAECLPLNQGSKLY